MATEEHKKLATIIKNVHDSLRLLSKEKGAEDAWDQHVQNTERLQKYANAMQKLASIWEENSSNAQMLAKSRVKWTTEYCISYYLTEKILLEKRSREERILESLEFDTSSCQYYENKLDHLRVLDVGSCFNPFKDMEYFDVTAIDLCPATDSVFQGDFLKIVVTAEDTAISPEDGKIHNLPGNYFNCVIFSLLLEYIPSSEQRLNCCQKAYDLLKFEGILIIITPDSQHVGKNAAIMKNWRYALATIGFNRIKFEKLQHITCMVFRKSIYARLAQRWAETHKEPHMSISIDIPQDSKWS